MKEGIRLKAAWGKDIMVTIMEMTPGTEIPEHNHPHEQVGTVVDGAVQVSINGETQTLRRGELYFVNHDEKHSIRAMDHGAKIEDVFYPIREEFRHPGAAETRYFPKYYPTA